MTEQEELVVASLREISGALQAIRELMSVQSQYILQLEKPPVSTENEKWRDPVTAVIGVLESAYDADEKDWEEHTVEEYRRVVTYAIRTLKQAIA